MKKSVIVLLVLIMTLFAISCGRKEAIKQEPETTSAQLMSTQVKEELNGDIKDPTEQIATSQPTPEVITTTPETVPQTPEVKEQEGCIIEGNGYKIEVVKATKEADYTGKEIAVITVVFTNNNSTPENYNGITINTAYQNGQKLGDDVVVMMDKIEPSTRAISNGQSVCLQNFFSLNDTTSPIEVNISIINPYSMATLASGSCTLTLQ